MPGIEVELSDLHGKVARKDRTGERMATVGGSGSSSNPFSISAGGGGGGIAISATTMPISPINWTGVNFFGNTLVIDADAISLAGWGCAYSGLSSPGLALVDSHITSLLFTLRGVLTTYEVHIISGSGTVVYPDIASAAWPPTHGKIVPVKGTDTKEAPLESWETLERNAQHLSRVLLYGPPGSGKSFVAMRAGVPDGQPVYRITLTEDTPMAELRGHFVPSGGGNWRFMDGPALRAFKNGGRLVLDEITRASDDCLSFCLALLDDPESARITVPADEESKGGTFTPHKNFTVWATTNDSANALTDALSDRFVIKVACDTVHPAALKTLPPKLASAVRSTFNGGPGPQVAFRQAAEFTRLIGGSVNMDEAAFLLWGARGRDVLRSLEIAQMADVLKK